MFSFILIYFCCYNSIYAQQVLQKAAYKFKIIQNLDANLNILETINGKDKMGVILFASINNQNWIAITIGDKTPYSFRIQNFKVDVNYPKKIIVYLGIQYFNGYKIPIQLFETYNLLNSSNIPESFIINVLSAKTGESISGQAFLDIAQIK